MSERHDDAGQVLQALDRIEALLERLVAVADKLTSPTVVYTRDPKDVVYLTTRGIPATPPEG